MQGIPTRLPHMTPVPTGSHWFRLLSLPGFRFSRPLATRKCWKKNPPRNFNHFNYSLEWKVKPGTFPSHPLRPTSAASSTRAGWHRPRGISHSLGKTFASTCASSSSPFGSVRHYCFDSPRTCNKEKLYFYAACPCPVSYPSEGKEKSEFVQAAKWRSSSFRDVLLAVVLLEMGKILPAAWAEAERKIQSWKQPDGLLLVDKSIYSCWKPTPKRYWRVKISGIRNSWRVWQY